MKRTLTLLALVVCAMTALGAEKAKRVLVETPHLSLVLDLFADGQPRYTYFGPRLDRRDVDNIPTPSGRTPLYPTFGQEVVHEAALAMTHADGSMAINFSCSRRRCSRSFSTLTLSSSAWNGFSRYALAPASSPRTRSSCRQLHLAVESRRKAGASFLQGKMGT